MIGVRNWDGIFIRRTIIRETCNGVVRIVQGKVGVMVDTSSNNSFWLTTNVTLFGVECEQVFRNITKIVIDIEQNMGLFVGNTYAT